MFAITPVAYIVCLGTSYLLGSNLTKLSMRLEKMDYESIDRIAHRALSEEGLDDECLSIVKSFNLILKKCNEVYKAKNVIVCAHDILHEIKHLECETEFSAKRNSNIERINRIRMIAEGMLTNGKAKDNTGESIAQITESIVADIQQEFPKVHIVNNVFTGKVIISRTDLHRIIINLVRNACQACLSMQSKMTPDYKPEVKLICDAEEQKIVFTVADNGQGFGKTEPRFGLSEKAEGSGFGLSSVKRLIHENGGELIIDSESGRTFVSVHLPSCHDISESMNSRAVDSTKYTMVLIDDERNHFQGTDGVIYFDDCTEFLLYFQREKPKLDAIVTDRFSGSYDCVQDGFAAACIQLGFEGPIILRSASVTEGDRPAENFFACGNSLSIGEINQLIDDYKSRLTLNT
ncbi:MAG: HAMP domain-containing histidine kinase [Deltaproteobacteria bacterium]|nr:HAMP domain-containing histidine kinase [Deltaproteobacteria bacterium]